MYQSTNMVKYWLMKSELDVYPYSQLVEDGMTHWDGVRNYQARNMMRDEMEIGDFILYYHSNCKPPHVAGIAKVCREGYGDFTSWDPSSKYFDEKSSPDNPRWFMVDIEPVCEFDTMVSLNAVREEEVLADMLLIRRGQRLSIQPVQQNEFEHICQMGGVDLSILDR